MPSNCSSGSSSDLARLIEQAEKQSRSRQVVVEERKSQRPPSAKRVQAAQHRGEAGQRLEQAGAGQHRSAGQGRSGAARSGTVERPDEGRLGPSAARTIASRCCRTRPSEFLPQYELMIERYYQRLAEEQRVASEPASRGTSRCGRRNARATVRRFRWPSRARPAPLLWRRPPAVRAGRWATCALARVGPAQSDPGEVGRRDDHLRRPPGPSSAGWPCWPAAGRGRLVPLGRLQPQRGRLRTGRHGLHVRRQHARPRPYGSNVERASTTSWPTRRRAASSTCPTPAATGRCTATASPRCFWPNATA